MLKARLEELLGGPVRILGRLPVGFGLEGLRIMASDGRVLAVKAVQDHEATSESGETGSSPLLTEAFMLGELARLSRLPVPKVHLADPGLLVMDYIDNDGGPITAAVEQDAAAYVAALHEVRGPAFGYRRDTLIGPLAQPNPLTADWIPFFAEHRLLSMGRAAYAAGTLPADRLARLEQLADHLTDYLTEPDHPSLLHGDLWNGNVLVKGKTVAGFVDPAIYFGHPEIELAFTTLFGTFGAAFFARYEALRPLAPGFHEVRKDIYNLYPRLVHLHLFGTAYLSGIEQVLRRFGG